MTKKCNFCNNSHELPNLGNSNDFWYWQPNKTLTGGTHICKVRRRFNCQRWDKNNSERAKEKYKKSRNKRRSTPKGRLRHSFSSLMSYRLSGKNLKSTFDIVTYNLDELKKHLESKFQPGMTWDNYGEWEIDHIIPDCAFNYSSPDDEDFKKCWELSNLQPLWSKDNKIKNGKF